MWAECISVKCYKGLRGTYPLGLDLTSRRVISEKHLAGARHGYLDLGERADPAAPVIDRARVCNLFFINLRYKLSFNITHTAEVMEDKQRSG